MPATLRVFGLGNPPQTPCRIVPPSSFGFPGKAFAGKSLGGGKIRGRALGAKLGVKELYFRHDKHSATAAVPTCRLAAKAIRTRIAKAA